MKENISYTYKKNKKKKALKKELRAIFLIVIASLLFVALFIFVLLFLRGTKSGGEITYPTSPLTVDGSSRYAYIESDSLPNKITMPSAPVMLSVGGASRYVPYNGYVYLYSSEMYLSVYEMYGTTYDLFSSQYVSDLYAGELTNSWIYKSATKSTGYYNGYPTEYECGEFDIVNVSGTVTKEIYVVSLTMDLGVGLPINISVATPDEKKLYAAGQLVERVGNTIMDISNTSYTNEDTLSDIGSADIGIPEVY